MEFTQEQQSVLNEISIPDLVLECMRRLYADNRVKNRARIGWLLSFIRQFEKGYIRQGMAIANPPKFAKYVQEKPAEPVELHLIANEQTEQPSKKGGRPKKNQEKECCTSE